MGSEGTFLTAHLSTQHCVKSRDRSAGNNEEGPAPCPGSNCVLNRVHGRGHIRLSVQLEGSPKGAWGVEKAACRANNDVLCHSCQDSGVWGCLPQGDTGQNVRSCWLGWDTLNAAGSF